MSQSLPYDEIRIDKNGKLNTPDDSDIKYYIEVDLKHPDNITEETKYFPLCLENKMSTQDKFSE